MNLSQWLIASYVYYNPDFGGVRYMSDGEFDALSKQLYEEYDSIEHIHKPLVSKENLRCGSCVGIVWPNIVKACAYDWFKSLGGNSV
jgi:hypothetical protein